MCSCTWNPFFICLPMTSSGGSWSYDVTVYQNRQTKMLTFQHSCDRISLLKLQHPQRQEAAMQERFETFTVLINRISRDIRRIKNQEMAAYHLRSVHVSCLYYIYSLDGVTAAELCEHCEEDKATISRALDYLETNGFIVRGSEQAKRYRSPLRLTERSGSRQQNCRENWRCPGYNQPYPHRGRTSGILPQPFCHQRKS